ncbi:hypothetical protein AAG906_035278 [Vitis piasezkii]
MCHQRFKDKGSDKGGFGGGGGGDSDRGGFGGRGRGRRDQSGGWNNRNNSGENNKSFEWNKESNNNGEGWKGHDGAVSWGQGGGDKGPRNWNSGTGRTSNQYGVGIVRVQEQGVSPAKDYGGSSVEANNLNSQSSGWNKGSAQTSVAVWSVGNQSIAGAQAEAWDKQGSGWNRGTSTGSGSMTRDGAETWNQSKAPDGAQSSAWNQTKNSKEGTSNFREATDSWDPLGRFFTSAASETNPDFLFGLDKGLALPPREIARSNASTHGSRCASQGLFGEIGSGIEGSPVVGDPVVSPWTSR